MWRNHHLEAQSPPDGGLLGDMFEILHNFSMWPGYNLQYIWKPTTPPVVKKYSKHFCIQTSCHKSQRKPSETQKNMFFASEIWRILTVRAKKLSPPRVSYLEKISWNQRCSEYIHIPQESFVAKFIGPIFHNRAAKLTDVIFGRFRSFRAVSREMCTSWKKFYWTKLVHLGEFYNI